MLGWTGALTRSLARILLGLFYRRCTVSGVERVPASAPLIVCANHHGSLVDPLALIAAIPRPLRPLAKAPLFENLLLRPFLAALRALPVYRPQDRHLVSGSNAALLGACDHALAEGGGLLIFPEGRSKPEPALSELRPGAARIALDAEAARGFSLGVQVLPVAIHLVEAERFRRGRILVEVGQPIAVADFRALHQGSAEAAVRALLDRIAADLRTLLIEVETADELRLLRVALRAWSQERGLRPSDDEEVALARRFGRGYRALSRSDPGSIQTLRNAAQSYDRTLRHFRLDDHQIDRRRSWGRALAYLVREGGAVALGAPLGLLGAAANWLPYRAVSLVAARYSDSADSWASATLAVAVALFPLYWLVLAAMTAALASPAAAALVLVLAPLAGLWSLRFRDRHARLAGEVRAFLLLAGGGGLAAHLRSSRRAIHDEVERLKRRLDAQDAGGAAATKPFGSESTGSSREPGARLV